MPPPRAPPKAANSRPDPARPVGSDRLAGDELLATLNPAQRRAVTSDADTVAILAGPGSGKTHTLASRVVWLIDRMGYRPEDVVVATFTVKAAREMKERIGRALGGECEKKIVLGTFHSIARRYLAAYGKHVGLAPKFGIADDGDSRAIIQRICKRMQTTVEPAAARSWISKKKAKGTNEPPAKPKKAQQPTEMERDLELIFADYQAQLERSNLLDYDDLLVRCVELLQTHPSCVANVQAVLIDEYQDTNGIQYELMKLLAQKRERITVVGDPDQSIYGWRSAEVRNLYRLLREFPDTEEIALEDNYRSSRAILALSLAVIQEDKKRYQKVLKPVRDRGTRPVLRKLRSASVEGEWLVSEIRRIMCMMGGMVKLQDVAILLRSAALSRHIESALGKAGIAYRMVGGFKFYDRIEVKVVLDYLRVIYQPDNNDAVARILNVPRRGIGDTTIKNLLEEAEHAKLSLWSLLVKHCRGDRTSRTSIKKAVEQKLSGDLIRTINAARKTIEQGDYNLVDVIDQLVAQLKLQKYLEDNYPDDHEQRWTNVREFITLAGDFARDLNAHQAEDALPSIDGIAQVADVDTLAKFLANVSLASDAQTGNKTDRDESAVVTISTIHAAKGLEWPVVFVPAVYQGSIPHSRSEDLDEERRLLYVAMTRAKVSLYLSWPIYTSQGGNGGQKAELSPFLPEEVVKGFAKKGPLFDKHVIEEIGKILGREIPEQAEVFQNMPLNAAADDDLFPIDPEEQKREFRAYPSAGVSGGDSGPKQPPKKRQRTTFGIEFNGMDVEILGQKEYVTTMDGASKFTVAALPGFTTAGAHRQAMTAAAAAAPPKIIRSESIGGTSSRARTGPGARTKIAADQPTLRGFMKQSPPEAANTNANALPPAKPNQPFQRTASLPNPKPIPGASSSSTIHPSLSNHRINRGPSLPKPLTTTSSLAEEEKDLPRKQYAFLSSSPPRPRAKDEAGDEATELPPASSPAEPSRPVACLHATTTTTGPRARAPFGRPQGLQMGGGLAPMERLRKPFKPLTINK